MTTTALSAHDIAEFLQNNPGFLAEHSVMFANLKLPHPHDGKVISLAERQILALRAQTRDLENRLGGLLFNASGNEQILHKLTTWSALLLAEPQAEKLPDLITKNLHTLFGVPFVELRLWQESGDNLRDPTEALAKPYCGPAANQAWACILPDPAQSLAAIALRAPDASCTLGVLVLGSDDPERFTQAMDTSFLDTLGRLAGAALSRFIATPSGHDA